MGGVISRVTFGSGVATGLTIAFGLMSKIGFGLGNGT
jgi:hypothetical protein